MSLINVVRSNPDPFYRYKMPRIQSKIEGKGNGIKSLVINLPAVAKALARPPMYLTKFFGFELGAQTIINEKMERYIINGAHDASKFQDLLDVFISKFVLCKSCKNPETDLVVNKKTDSVSLNCKACGQITEVDPRHKLTGIIVKNPPPKKKVKNHASAPTNGLDNDAENDDEDGDEESGDEMFKRINAEAAQLDATQSQLQKEDWGQDMSEEAVRARTKEVSHAMSKVMVVDEDDEDDGADENSPYDALGIWVEEEDNPSDVDIYKKATELGVESRHRTMQVLAQTMFTEKIISANQIKKRCALLTKMTTSERHEKALLGGMEALISKNPTLIDQVPKILIQLYQADLISEDVIRKWGSRASKKYTDKETSRKIRKAAEPFLKWLDEADEESEEDD